MYPQGLNKYQQRKSTMHPILINYSLINFTEYILCIKRLSLFGTYRPIKKKLMLDYMFFQCFLFMKF